LSAAQERFWFLDQFIPNRSAYNIPVAQKIHGDLNRDALREALRRVVLRHEALRSLFGATTQLGSGNSSREIFTSPSYSRAASSTRPSARMFLAAVRFGSSALRSWMTGVGGGPLPV
jgi:hypothetical protein